MPKKKLSKRQLSVIEDLFIGELDEQAVLDKYKVSRNTYNKWLADEHFAEHFDRRIASAYRQSAVLLARYAPLAAAKLVQLTESQSQETARKACLDIISGPSIAAKKTDQPPTVALGGQPTQPQTAQTQQLQQITEQTASRLLAALAEEKDDE